MGAPYFFQIRDLDTRANFCKKHFIQQPSKMSMEPSQKEKYCATQMEPTNPPI